MKKLTNNKLSSIHLWSLMVPCSYVIHKRYNYLLVLSVENILQFMWELKNSLAEDESNLQIVFGKNRFLHTLAIICLHYYLYCLGEQELGRSL